MSKVPQCHSQLPNTSQPNRYAFLVWTHQPSIICLRNYRLHAAIPPVTQTWNDTLNQLFEESKAVIASELEKGVCIFDKSKPTCLATDWSKSGIGFWLFQKHCECASKKPFCCPTGWKIALVGSQFTHPAESRYAPVEGEALAVADALDKA